MHMEVKLVAMVMMRVCIRRYRKFYKKGMVEMGATTIVRMVERITFIFPKLSSTRWSDTSSSRVKFSPPHLWHRPSHYRPMYLQRHQDVYKLNSRHYIQYLWERRLHPWDWTSKRPSFSSQESTMNPHPQPTYT